MRANIITRLQKQIGTKSDRGNGTQMSHALCWLLLLSTESLVFCARRVIRAIYSCVVQTAGARANPKGIAGIVTERQWMLVDAGGKVPSWGTDQV